MVNINENKLNAAQDKISTLSRARIDYCTTANTMHESSRLDGNPDTIQIRTEFYNQHNILEELQKFAR